LLTWIISWLWIWVLQAIIGLFKHLMCWQCSWRDTVLEQEVEFAMSVVKAVRSMRADYQLNKLKTECKFLYFCFIYYYCYWWLWWCMVMADGSWTPCGRGTVVSIVYCWCTYWCPETNSWENYLTLFTILCCGILLWAQVWTHTYILGMMLNCIRTEWNYIE